jgi:hypothetical protein
MAEFRLGRLKFNWRGEWSPSTAYVVDDIVKLGGNTYVCTVNHTSAVREDLWYSTDFNIGTPRWQIHVEGLRQRGAWVGLTTYSINDVFQYGNGQFRVITPHYSVGAGVSLQYTIDYISGNNGEGGWSYDTEYQYGDFVYYNGSMYVGIITAGSGSVNRGIRPAVGINTAWRLMTTGISTAGVTTFQYNSTYEYGSLVTYGGNTYVATASSTSAVGAPAGLGATSTSEWQLLVPGLRYAGVWSTVTDYQLNDVVSYIQSSYVSIASSNTGNLPTTTVGQWGLLAQGDAGAVVANQGDLLTRSSTGVVALGIGSTGTVLRSTGVDPIWDYIGNAPANYYVSSVGQDWVTWGNTPETPWKTIRFACDTIASEGLAPAVLHVAAGVYQEALPITVPRFTDIRGASQRGVFVEPNNPGIATGTMWRLNDSNVLSEMTFRGMTGWAKTTSDPEFILKADTGTLRHPPAGIYIELDPNNPIEFKSPYVKECTGIGTGCVGAYIDGNHFVGVTSSYKSCLFHAYTVLADSGVGYWVDNGAKCEIISGFTYWCDYGYLTTNGGIIRALNGNNSYGEFGAVSLGYSQDEVFKPADLDGEILEYPTGGLIVVGGGVTVGAAVTGEESGARGTVIFDIPSTNRIIYRPVGMETFRPNEVIYIGGGFVGSGATARLLDNPDAISGIKGFIFPLKGLTEEPRPRGSITFVGVSSTSPITRRTSGPLYGPAAGSGSTVPAGIGSDSFAYVISAVTSYVPPTYGLAGYAGTYYQAALGAAGSYPSVQVNGSATGTGAFLNIVIDGSGFVSNFGISTSGIDYVQNEPLSIDGTQIGGVAGVAITFSADTIRGTAIVRTNVEKVNQGFDGQDITIRYDYSQIRLTGHDFLEIGIGNRLQSNYPNKPNSFPIDGNQKIEGFPGRVYFVTTDQDGNFKVGNYFAVDQATGSATLNAAAFNLSGLTSLRLGSLGGQIGEAINEFSSDGSMSGNSNTAVPTEFAVKTYVDTQTLLGRGFAYWIATS